MEDVSPDDLFDLCDNSNRLLKYMGTMRVSRNDAMNILCNCLAILADTLSIKPPEMKNALEIVYFHYTTLCNDRQKMKGKKDAAE